MASRKLTKLDQQRKEQTLLELHSLGYTHAEIATIEGYKNSKSVSRAIKNAREKPANADDMRADSDVALDYVAKKCVEIINHPQPQHTSIGKILWNVTLCDCPNGGMSEVRADHTPECAIKPAVNQTNLVSAAKLIVKIDESRRKMHGIDKRAPLSEDEAMLQANAWLARFPVIPPQTYRAEILSVEAAEHTDPLPTRYVADRRPVDPMTGEVGS